MGWWSQFDRGEVAADFERIAASGLDNVRVFLTWEDFQPSPETVDREILGRLVEVADLAAELELALIPTLFTGHMSGVNWIPAGALGGPAADDRFRVISRGAIAEGGPRTWYSDPAVADAQTLLAAEAAAALAGHEAHGYPIYARWANGPTGNCSRFSRGSAAGSAPAATSCSASSVSPPTIDPIRSDPNRRAEGASSLLVDEDAAAAYTARALEEPAARPRQARAHVWTLAN